MNIENYNQEEIPLIRIPANLVEPKSFPLSSVYRIPKNKKDKTPKTKDDKKLDKELDKIVNGTDEEEQEENLSLMSFEELKQMSKTPSKEEENEVKWLNHLLKHFVLLCIILTSLLMQMIHKISISLLEEPLSKN